MKKLALLVCTALALMAAPAGAQICSPVPFTLTNGQPADADEVMANFDSTVDCVNTNGAKNGVNSDITSLTGLTTSIPTGVGGVPVGVVLPYGGSSAPTGYLLCGGQAVSRATYSALFAVVGTSFGAGDGATTFNVPDMRGRAAFGLDNIGGSAANRVTAGVSGITGTTLGASGGDQAMQQHNHTGTVSITDPGHTHAITDPGHNHTISPTALQNSGLTFTPAGGANIVAASGAASTQLAFTGISVTGNTTGITATTSINNTGAGASQNMPPAMMVNYIIRY